VKKEIFWQGNFLNLENVNCEILEKIWGFDSQTLEISKIFLLKF